MGLFILLGGNALISLLIAGLDTATVRLPNPGMVYLPLVAMLAYHWGWRTGIGAGVVAFICVYLFFVPPYIGLKAPTPTALAQLLTLALVLVFTLALVQLAVSRRSAAERGAARFAALNAVGQALGSELDQQRLLMRIAEAARTLTGASFAAFTLRPVDRAGQPLVPAEGSAFHLAAVTGVTPDQERVFRRIPLGGEGILAPIFRHGVPVRVADVLTMEQSAHGGTLAHGALGMPEPAPAHAAASEAPSTKRDTARRAAEAYAAGHAEVEDLGTVGIPRGHPVVRSFLGVPLLDREGRVAGGLLLGHDDPGRFTENDEALLLGLAAQASIAMENARLYQEAKLQGRELDAIFESISDGISVVDSAGTLLRENLAARRIREHLAEQQSRPSGLGSNAAVTDFTRLAMATDAGTDEGASSTSTLVVRDADGEQREYLLTAAPVRLAAPGSVERNAPVAKRAKPSRLASGQKPNQAEQPEEASATVIVAHDVTETHRLLEERRARAEAESRRSLLQMVIGELPSGVFLVRGTDARLALINPAGQADWGAEWAEGEPMDAFLERNGIRVLKPTGEAMALDELASVGTLLSGQAIRHFQEIIHRPDGTALPVLVNAVPLDQHLFATSGTTTPDGGAIDALTTEESEPAALIVLQDVSALKEAEHLKDEFIAIAAHELKTPIAAVKGYSGMLTTRQDANGASTLAPWQQEALETIDQATTRLVELVDDLLDVSRIQAGGLQLRPEPHDLVALTRRVLRRAQVTAANHKLVLECAEPYVVAQVDVRRAEQVMGNLVNNAVKYSPAGGEVRVTITVDERAGEAVVSVRDTGIGIPENQRAQLFGRFARAENAREMGILGTGLGLFLTRELVERQGGRIWFESEEGRGSTFYVTFPLVVESSTEDSAPISL